MLLKSNAACYLPMQYTPAAKFECPWTIWFLPFSFFLVFGAVSIQTNYLRLNKERKSIWLNKKILESEERADLSPEVRVNKMDFPTGSCKILFNTKMDKSLAEYSIGIYLFCQYGTDQQSYFMFLAYLSWWTSAEKLHWNFHRNFRKV